MDSEAQEGGVEMPMSGGFVGLHESSMLKLLTSGSDTEMDDSSIRPFEAKSKKIIRYRGCLKNHAASIGGHAVDGCGEFMPGGEEGTLDALNCAACGCHRNFHKTEVEGEADCHPCDCHHTCKERKGSALPATTKVVARPAAEPMTRASLSNGPTDSDDQDGGMSASAKAKKKRFRTKFSAEQKEKMVSFADKLGWKTEKDDGGAVQAFCADIGVERHALKVWMHNNKNTLGNKRFKAK